MIQFHPERTQRESISTEVVFSVKFASIQIADELAEPIQSRNLQGNPIVLSRAEYKAIKSFNPWTTENNL